MPPLFETINELNGRSKSGHVRNKMPNWPDKARAIPNVLLRSALFSIIGRGPRRDLVDEQVQGYGNVNIRYTGTQLDQSDLSVWMTVLHLSRRQHIGAQHVCRVTAYQLLQMLRRTDSGKNRAILQRQLSLLANNLITIDNSEHTYEGSLIEELYREAKTQAYLIQLNPNLDTLFRDGSCTWVHWNVRNELVGQPLAQWLHGFYTSHAQPFDLKIQTIHGLCGSNAACMRDFSRALRKSLDVVARALELNREQFLWEVKDGRVRVKRSHLIPR